MCPLSPGDPAPDFALLDQEGHLVRLADFRGGMLLVYFYPKADTPGCTTQARSVRDAREELTSLGLSVVGISPDPPERQAAFDAKHGLRFPLLSDPDHAVAEAYGTWGQRSLYGRTFMGIIRSSFLIDENGVILQAWYKVSPADTVPKATSAVPG